MICVRVLRKLRTKLSMTLDVQKIRLKTFMESSIHYPIKLKYAKLCAILLRKLPFKSRL